MPIHYKLSRQRTILGKDRPGLTDKHVMWLDNTWQYLTILDNTWQYLEKISQVWQICMWCDLTSPCVTLGRPGLLLSDLVHIRLLRRQPSSPKHDDDAYFAQDKRASIPYGSTFFCKLCQFARLSSGCWSCQNIRKNCLLLLLRIFYVLCIMLVDSIMKVRATEMCVSRKDQPWDVSMVACVCPVCVPAFSPVCVSEKQPRKQNQGHQYFSVNQTGHSMAVASFPFLHLSRSPCPIIIE